MTTSREQQDEQAKAYGQIVARAWSDAAFKQRLLADPYAVPAGITVQMHEASADTIHFVLPLRPVELSDEQLAAVAGGMCSGGDCYPCALS